MPIRRLRLKRRAPPSPRVEALVADLRGALARLALALRGVSAATSFLRDPRELELFDDFLSGFLPERLTGAGRRPPG